MGLPCRARVNYRGYAVAVHRRLCYPHVTPAAVYSIYIWGPGLLDERAEDLPSVFPRSALGPRATRSSRGARTVRYAHPNRAGAMNSAHNVRQSRL